MTSYLIHSSPFEDLILAADGERLTGLYFAESQTPDDREDWKREPRHPVLLEASRQLDEYFAGKRTAFSIPQRFAGTKFQERVWRAIATIPFGQTITYSDLAERAGNPGAVRAAGSNTGRNPIGIIIPCHRVVGRHGAIGGFGGGLPWKRFLLELEQRTVGLRDELVLQPGGFR